MPELRYDVGVALAAPKRDENGWLRAEGVMTRAGVFEYRRADGSVQRELRPEDEVFAPQSLETFEAIPITDYHPAGLLDAKTASKYQRGSVRKARRDGEYLKGGLLVTDASLISKMERGQTALSVGYQVEYDRTPGVHPVYGAYDGVQRNIRANHLAVLDVGRAGPEARVRMDGAYAILPPLDKTAAQGQPARAERMIHLDKTTESELVNAAVKTATEQSARADAAEARAKAATDALTEMRVRAETAEGEAKSLRIAIEEKDKRLDAAKDAEDLQAQVASLKAALAVSEKARLDAESPERLHAAVKARVSIETAASQILGEKARLDVSDRELMVHVIEHLQGASEITNDTPDAYIRARFDGAVSVALRGRKTLAQITQLARQDAAQPVNAQTARERMIARNRNMNQGAK